MYSITLSDTTTEATLPLLNVPLTEAQIEGATDVETLDKNVYTDFFAKKRLWSHVWRYMSEADFAILRGFYDRQFTLYEYPVLTVEGLDVEDVVVRMTLSPQHVIDNCGSVESVEVTFRETVQMTQDFGSS